MRQVLEFASSASTCCLCAHAPAVTSCARAAATCCCLQVAPYAFTTLRPQLGAITDVPGADSDAAAGDEQPWVSAAPMQGDGSSGGGSSSRHLIVADLPGLVPGAHAGRGRGTAFLAHMQRALCIAVVLDMTGAPGGGTCGDADAGQGADTGWAAGSSLVPYTPVQQLSILQVRMPAGGQCMHEQQDNAACRRAAHANAGVGCSCRRSCSDTTLPRCACRDWSSQTSWMH